MYNLWQSWYVKHKEVYFLRQKQTGVLTDKTEYSLYKYIFYSTTVFHYRIDNIYSHSKQTSFLTKVVNKSVSSWYKLKFPHCINLSAARTNQTNPITAEGFLTEVKLKLWFGCLEDSDEVDREDGSLELLNSLAYTTLYMLDTQNIATKYCKQRPAPYDSEQSSLFPVLRWKCHDVIALQGVELSYATASL